MPFHPNKTDNQEITTFTFPKNGMNTKSQSLGDGLATSISLDETSEIGLAKTRRTLFREIVHIASSIM